MRKISALLLVWAFLFGSAIAQSPYRIAILGCHKQFLPAPSLLRYVEARPDLCLWIGDNIYADTQNDIDFLDSCYQAMAAKPAFRQLMGMAPYMATWDDHDYGDNNESRHYPLKEASKELFRRFWKLENKIPASREGIYYAEFYEVEGKKVQVIMLDVRYHRDEPGPLGDVLGEEQWKWLEEELENAADLRLIVSGSQVLLPGESGSETWDEYPLARKRLFETISKKGAEGVVFITGDQHYGEVCRMKAAYDLDAIELQFAGINQIEKAEYNPFRVAGASKGLHSYALLDLFLKQGKYDPPHLLFQVYDGQTNLLEFSYRINFSELFLELEIDPDTAFATEKKIWMSHKYPALEIRYTLDGSQPTGSSNLYQEAIRIHEQTQLKAALFSAEGYRRSRVFTQTYEKLSFYEPVRGRNLEKGLRFRYMEGQFQNLHEAEKATPLKTGLALDFDVAQIGREDSFAVFYEGYIEVEQDGVYTFTLLSDDGSALLLHDRKVVDNDGSHSKRLRKGEVALKKGLHPIKIQYFDDYSGQVLKVFYQVNGGEEQALSVESLFHPSQ